MTDQAYLSKLQNAISAVKAEHLRLGERLLDLEKLAMQEHTPGQVAKQLLDVWCNLWGAHYRAKYSLTPARDMKAFKDKLKEMTPEELQLRMRRYLATDDPFFVSLKHPLNLFFSQINRFADATPEAIEPRPVGCRHEPPCRSEAQHTRLSMQERRAVAM